MANGNGNGMWQKIAIGAIGVLTTITLGWTTTMSGQVSEHEKELAVRSEITRQAAGVGQRNSEKIEELDEKIEVIDDKVDRIQMLQELDLRSRGVPIPPHE